MIPMFYTGISQQPENVRLPSQVRDATNVDFTVENGASKRPYTKFYHKLDPAPTSGRDVRIHSIERDENERYLVLYGDGNLRVFQEMGVQPPVMIEAVVTTDSDSSTYLAAGSADGTNIVLVTVNDYTLAINTTVATALETSPTYNYSSTWLNYGTMVSRQPAIGSYNRTIEDDDFAKAGYYVYSSGTQTFGYKNRSAGLLAAAWCTPGSNWNDVAKNPMGFCVGFQRLALSIAGGTLTLFSGAQYTLTKTGAFASYTPQSGDMIYISSATSAAGWAVVDSKVDADNIRVTARGSCVLAASAGTVNTTGIGIEYDVEANFDSSLGNTPSSMEEVAKKLEIALQKKGADGALISWTSIGSGGYFEIVSPYKGDDSVILNVSTPNYAGSTSIYDLTVVGRPFDFSGYTNVPGSGGNPTATQSVSSRWTRTYAPAQANARPDASTMPVKLVRDYAAVYPPKTINAISIAAAAVVTSIGHGLTNGQTVVISGTNSNPVIDGTRIATVLTADTYSVPVTTTGAGSAGTFYGKPGFTCSQIDWNYRLSGDDENNPAPQPLQDGLPLADILITENRLCLATGQYLVFSQSDDLFNLYASDWSNLVDSDPIVVPMATNKVVNCKYAIPFRQSVLVWTFNGEHIDFSWETALTATTIRSSQPVQAQTWSTRPVFIEDRIFFNSERGNYAEVNEYRYDDLAATNVASSVTQHVPVLVPIGIRSMCGVASEGALLLLPDDAYSIYVYRWHYTGNAKDQSAWSRYTFDSSYRISGMASIRNSVYLLIQTGTQYTIDCMVYEVPSDTF